MEEAGPGGLVKTSRYDENGDLVLEQDNAGHRTERRYDEHHNVICIKKQAEPGQSEKVASYAYDRMGRLTEQTDARGNRTLYQYGSDCALPSAIQYADGEELRLSHDQAGRLLAQEDACGRTEYGYNARNKRTLVRDGEGNESRWSYDGMGACLPCTRRGHGRRRRGNIPIPTISSTA